MMSAPDGPMRRLLYERSNGRITFDYKTRLFSTTEALPAVRDGRIDMTWYPCPHMAGTYPLLNWDAIPGIADNIYELEAAIFDPRMRAIYDKFYGDLNVKFLAPFFSVANNAIWSKKKVDTVDKFSGLKARTSGLLQTKTLEALGASAMTIAGTELETALIQGTVDAITTSLTYGWGRGFTDICDYAALWPITPGYFFSLVMNGDKFDSLPSDLQQIMLDTTAEMSHRQIFAMNAQLGTAMKAIGLTKCEIVYPSDVETAKAKELVKVVRDDYIEVAGPDGQKILDVIDDAVAKYRALLESL